MLGRYLFQAAINRVAELRKAIVMPAVENVAFDEFPQAFVQVQVRRIRGQKLQPYVERVG